MKRLSHLLILFFFIGNLSAQIPDGSIAPDFTVADIDGNQHNLYDVLAEGKSVILDFSATWCGPCWSYHSTGSLHDYMEQYGPEGTDESMVFYVECDVSTTIDDLNGIGGNTQGDWVTGTNYPILDAAYIGSMYQIGSYPTIMMVCPDRTVKRLGTNSASELKNNTGACSSIDIAPEMSFWANNYDGCNALTVEFTDTSWPRPESFFWDFGDGNTSTERNPVHTYDEVGDYNVSLQGTNTYGENETVKENYITVGEGNPLSTEKVGPESKDIGSGRYFEGGHQALIFNAMEDMVIESVTVFSDKEQERTVILRNSEGMVLNQRTMNIPIGTHRITLDLFVPQGTDYQLGLHSDAFLFRNDGGAAYPYMIDDLVSITRSTASTDPTRYYYYFYDWDVREAGCTTVISTEDELEQSIQMYPLPVNRYLTIEMEEPSSETPRVFNNIGQIINIPSNKDGNNWQLDFNSLQKGIYFVEIQNKMYSVPKH